MIVGGVQDVSELPQIDCRRAESVIIQNHTTPIRSIPILIQYHIAGGLNLISATRHRSPIPRIVVMRIFQGFEKVNIGLEILEVEVAIQMVVEVVVEAKKLDKVVVAATLDKDK